MDRRTDARAMTDRCVLGGVRPTPSYSARGRSRVEFRPRKVNRKDDRLTTLTGVRARYARTSPAISPAPYSTTFDELQNRRRWGRVGDEDENEKTVTNPAILLCCCCCCCCCRCRDIDYSIYPISSGYAVRQLHSIGVVDPESYV
jgi:hypothetical protein